MHRAEWLDGRPRPTLAGLKVPREFRGAAKEAAIQKTMDAMRDWRMSPFEREGTMVHGLRSGLCLKGHGWQAADREASEIVGTALRLLGAVRPDYQQGQRDATTPMENCSWCTLEIPEEDRSENRKPRYCSPECAKTALVWRQEEWAFRDKLLHDSALRIVNRESLPMHRCEQCGDPFRPFNGRAMDQRFCSRRCQALHRRTKPDKRCETCGDPFRPPLPDSRFCSMRCFNAMQHEERECVVCTEPFRPTRADTRFCGPACTKYAYKVRKGLLRSLTAPAFDYVMRIAA